MRSVVEGVEQAPRVETGVRTQEVQGNSAIQGAMAAPEPFGLAVLAGLGAEITGVRTAAQALEPLSAMRRALRDSRAATPVVPDLGHLGAGRPLSDDERQRFDAAMDHDLSHVRIHVDARSARAAEQLQAHAFAVGADIYFGPGEYQPGSPATDRLLAHELTHVVQFDEGRLPTGGEDEVSSPSDPAELEAYAAEDEILGALRHGDEVGDVIARSQGGAVPESVAERIPGHAPGAGPEASQGPADALGQAAHSLGASMFAGGGEIHRRGGRAGLERAGYGTRDDVLVRVEPGGPAAAPRGSSAPGQGAASSGRARVKVPADSSRSGREPVQEGVEAGARDVADSSTAAKPRPARAKPVNGRRGSARLAVQVARLSKVASGVDLGGFQGDVERARSSIQARAERLRSALGSTGERGRASVGARLDEASTELRGVLAAPRGRLEGAHTEVPERLVAVREAAEARIGREAADLARDAASRDEAREGALHAEVEEAIAGIAASPDVIEAVAAMGIAGAEEARERGGVSDSTPRGQGQGEEEDPRAEAAEEAAGEIEALTADAIAILSGERAREIIASRMGLDPEAREDTNDDAVSGVEAAAEETRRGADEDARAISEDIERSRRTSARHLDLLEHAAAAGVRADVEAAATRVASHEAELRSTLDVEVDAALGEVERIVEAALGMARGARPGDLEERLAPLRAELVEIGARLDPVEAQLLDALGRVQEKLEGALSERLGGAAEQAADAVEDFDRAADADTRDLEERLGLAPEGLRRAVDKAATDPDAVDQAVRSEASSVDTSDLVVDAAQIQGAVQQGIDAILADLPRRMKAAVLAAKDVRDEERDGDEDEVVDPGAEARAVLESALPQAEEASGPASTGTEERDAEEEGAGGAKSQRLLEDLEASVLELPEPALEEAEEPEEARRGERDTEAAQQKREDAEGRGAEEDEEEDEEEQDEEAGEEEQALEAVEVPEGERRRGPGDTRDKKPKAEGEDEEGEELSPQEQLEALKAEQEALQSRLDAIGEEMEDNQEEMEELQVEVDEVDEELAEKREDLSERQGRLQEKAEKAQAAGKKPRDPQSDSTVVSLNREIEETLPREKEDLAEETNEIREENEELDEEREEVSAELEEVGKRIAELEGKMRGGGGGGPVAEPSITKSSAKLLGMLQSTVKPKLDRELKAAEKKQKTTETALETLDSNEVTVKGAIDTANGAIGRANGEIRSANAALTAALASEAPEGQAPVAPSADPACQAASARLSTAQSNLSKAQGDVTRHQGVLTQLQADRVKLKKELEDAKKKVEELKEKAKKLEDTMGQLAPPGAGMWDAFAAEFEVKCPPVPLAPGETNEEHGHEDPPDPDAQEQERKDAKAASDGARDRADAAKGEEPESDAPEKLEKDKTPADKKEEKEQKVMLEVSATMDLPPEQRAKRWADLEKKHKLTKAQLQKIHADRVAAAKTMVQNNKRKALANSKDGKFDSDRERWKASGLNEAQIRALEADKARTELREKALAIVGGANGQEAVDKLHAMGKGRKMSPAALLDHLAAVDPKHPGLSPEMAKAAKKARARKKKEIKAIKDPKARKRARRALKAATEAANSKEKDHKAATDLASALECDQDTANRHIDRLVESTGCTREEAADSLRNRGKNKPEEALKPAEIQRELARIRTLDPKDRARELSILAGKVDPQQLIGATMLPSASDPDGLMDGPTGNESLKNEVAAIKALPKEQQGAAWRALSEKTGQPLRTLYAANQRYERRQSAHNQYFAIKNDASISNEERARRIADLAKKLKVPVERLEMSAENKLERTRERLDKAKGQVMGLFGGDGKTNSELTDIDHDLKTGKISRAQADAKLKDIALRLGMPFDDLRNLHGFDSYQAMKKRWGKKLKKSPDEAADYVAKKSAEEDVPPERFLDEMRYFDPDKLESDEDKEAFANLKKWHEENPTKEEEEEAENREKAGLKKDEKVRKVCISETDAKDLTGQDKVDWDQMIAVENYIRGEMDDTIVNEAKIVEKLKGMPVWQRAGLLRRMPGLQTLLVKEINNNGKDKETQALADEARKTLAQARAYNRVIAGGADSERRKQEERAKTEKARRIQDRTIAAKEAAAVLKMPLPQARANLKAFAMARGKSYADAVRELKSHPEKSPKEVLKEAYSAKTKRGGPSQALKRRLADIYKLPPGEQAAALKALQGLAGLSAADLAEAGKAMARDDAIAKAVHDLRHLTPTQRKAELEKLAARYKIDVEDLEKLQETYAESLAATKTALAGDARFEDALKGSYKDVDAAAAALAAEHGLDKAEVLRLIEAERDQAFDESDNAKKLGARSMANLSRYGDECGKTPEQMLDYLMRSPRSGLPEHLQALQDELKKKLPDYQKQYSKAEQAAMDKLRARADDPEYRTNASALLDAIEADDEEAFKGAIAKMSGPDQALFKAEYNAKRELAIQNGDEVPPTFEEAVGDTVDGFWGVSSEESNQLLTEIPDSMEDAEAQLQEAMQAVDKEDPVYVTAASGMTEELRKGGEADPETIKFFLKQMSLAQRAAFLEDYRQLQNMAAQSNLTDDTHKLPNLQEVLEGDAEGLRWITDAQKVAATGIARADAAETRKVEEARQVATEAAAALKMDRRTAYRLVTKKAKDHNLSPRNALRFLQGKELVPDRQDNLSPFLKSQLEGLREAWKKPQPGEESGETVGGHTLNQKKVDEKADQLADCANGKGPHITATQLNELLNKCNPRELKELDAKLGGKLRDVIAKVLGRSNPARTGALIGMALAAPSTGALVAEEEAKANTEINNLLFGMDDFRAEEHDLGLLDSVSTMDPRATADPTTPAGMAQRMAWAASLPPEQRIKAFNELRKAVPPSKMSAQAVMGAYLGGERPTEAGGMLSPVLLEEIQRIEKLPPKERAEALATFEAMTGRKAADLRFAAVETAEQVGLAKKLHEIESLPASERLDKLNELAESSELSVNELQAIYERALASGQVKAGLKPVGEHVDKELDRIKLIADPAERKAALQALAEANDLAPSDLLAHVKKRLEEGRKERRALAAQRKGAQKLEDLFREGDGDKIKKQLEQYRTQPEQLKKIAEQYGGMDALRAALKREFGDDSHDYVDLNPILQEAEACTPEPELPAGVSGELSDEINRLMAAGSPDWRAALRAKHPGLSPTDLEILGEHAKWKKDKLDRQVGYAQTRFENELDSTWIEDDRIQQLVNETPHDVLLALAERMKPRDLGAEIVAGVGEDVGSDFIAKLGQAQEIALLPPEQKKARLQAARVDHKYNQLKEEFDDWMYADDERIAELMADCSPEEFKLLNERFEGRLQDKIDQNTGGISLGDVVAGIATVVLVGAMGPAGLLVGAAIWAAMGDSETEQSLANSQAKLRASAVDYSKPPEERFPLVQGRVDDAYAEITTELASVWTSDNDVVAALKGLNPRELAAVVEKFRDENGMELLDSLRGGLDDDAYAQAVAMVAESEDAMGGVDRRQQMADRCRQLAIADRLKQLKKDPRHQGKSDTELYAIVEKEKGKIDKMAADRVKKIRESANNIFKAVDGWWNNDTDSMLKEMAALSPEEVEMVKIEYRRHFGRDMDIDVRGEMGQYNAEEMKVAERLMSSNPDRRVEGLRMYLLEGYRMFDVEDEQMIFDTLEKMSVEERTKLVAGFEGEQFIERLKEDLGENECRMVDALTHIDPKTGKANANPAIVAAAKMKMHIHGSGDWWDLSAAGTKEEELISELDSLTPEQIREAEAYYNQHLAEDGSTFIADLKSDFGDGRDWDIIEAELRGDKVTADANRLKWAAQEENWLAGTGYELIMGTDEDLLEKTLTAGKEGRGGRDEAHLAKVRARFNNLFGQEGGRYEGDKDDARDAFDRLVDEETDGLETIYFTELGKKGEASDEITLLYAMQGVGTDETKLKKVLEKYYDKPPAEREQFAALFRQRSVELLGLDMSLEEWVGSETSGSEGFDMALLVKGKPRTPEEKLEVARMRWDFERGAGAGFGNLIMGVMDATGGSSASEVLADSMAEMEACFDENGKLLPGQEARLEEVASWQEQDIKTYRETKDSVAEAIGDTVAAIGAVAAGILTAGAAWYIMAAAAMAAAAAGTLFKAAIKGNSFGWEEGLSDMGSMAIAGLTAGMGGAAFKGFEAAAKAATTAFKKYAIMAVQGAIEGAIESFLQAVLTSEQAWEQGDVALLTHILKSTAIGGFNGAAGAVMAGVLEDSPIGKRIKRIEDGNPLAHSTAEHYGLKYANGMITAVGGKVVDPNNWEAWADGKELGLGDLKAVLVMPMLKAAMQTAKARSKGVNPKKLEDDARKTAETTREEIATLKLKRDDLDDPAAISALDAHIKKLQKSFNEQRQTLAWIIEDNQVLAQREESIKRVKRGLDTEPDGQVDAMEDAQRTGAVRRVVAEAEAEDDPTPAPKTVYTEDPDGVLADIARGLIAANKEAGLELSDEDLAGLAELAGVPKPRAPRPQEDPGAPIEPDRVVDIGEDGPVPRRARGGDAVDEAPVIVGKPIVPIGDVDDAEALADVPPAQRARMAGEDPEAARALFQSDAAEAVDDGFEDVGQNREARLRAAKQVADRFGGNPAEILDEMPAGAAPAVRKGLKALRNEQLDDAGEEVGRRHEGVAVDTDAEPPRVTVEPDAPPAARRAAERLAEEHGAEVEDAPPRRATDEDEPAPAPAPVKRTPEQQALDDEVESQLARASKQIAESLDLGSRRGDDEDEAFDNRRSATAHKRVELLGAVRQLGDVDPDLALRAAQLAGEAPAELLGALAGSLDRARTKARRGDPDGAQAELKRGLSKLKTLGELETPERSSANADAARAAARRLRDDPEARLSPAEARAMLDHAVQYTRMRQVDDAGGDMDEGLSHLGQGGMCGPARARGAMMLQAMGIDAGVDPDVMARFARANDLEVEGPVAGRVAWHSTTDDDWNPSPNGTFGAAAQHHFMAVRMPDGNTYLMDPTHGQFLIDSPTYAGIRQRLLSTPAGVRMAGELTERGFIRLDDETATAYGQALTGKGRKFTTEDFEQGTVRPDDTRADRLVDGEDKEKISPQVVEAFDKLPRRAMEPEADEPSLTPPRARARSAAGAPGADEVLAPQVARPSYDPEGPIMLHGGHHRFAALMHIVESGDLGGVDLDQVVGRNGETVRDLHQMWSSGKISSGNNPDHFSPSKARKLAKSIREHGYLTDPDQAPDAVKGMGAGREDDVRGFNLITGQGIRTHADHGEGTELKGFHKFIVGEAADGSEDAPYKRVLEEQAYVKGVEVRVLSDDEFDQLTDSKSGQAVTMIEGGKPVIAVRRGAHPDEMLEEGLHVHQIRRDRLGVKDLSEENLADWDDKPMAEKVKLYQIKLEAELDAAQTLQGMDISPEKAAKVQETIRNLMKRKKEVGRLAKQVDAGEEPAAPKYLEQKPRMFSKASKAKEGAAAEDEPAAWVPGKSPIDEILIEDERIASQERILAQVETRPAPPPEESLSWKVADHDVSPKAAKDYWKATTGVLDDEVANTLLMRSGGDWNQLRETFKDEPLAMEFMTSWRKEKVDGIVAELKKDFPHVDVVDLGSSSPTSDYDMTARGPGAAKFLDRFNHAVEGKFARPSGNLLDTNVYAEPVEVLPRKGTPGHDLVDRLAKDLPLERARALRAAVDQQQGEVAWLQVRRHVDDKQWNELVEDFGQDSEELRASMQKAAWRHRALEAEVTRKRQELIDRGVPDDEDLDLRARNALYRDELREIDARMAREDGSSPAEGLVAEVMERQSRALYFANEAYMTEGAVRHVPGNLQGKQGLALTESQKLASAVEQYGYLRGRLASSETPEPAELLEAGKYLSRMADVPAPAQRREDLQGLGAELDRIRKDPSLRAPGARDAAVADALRDHGFGTDEGAPRRAMMAMECMFRDQIESAKQPRGEGRDYEEAAEDEPGGRRRGQRRIATPARAGELRAADTRDAHLAEGRALLDEDPDGAMTVALQVADQFGSRAGQAAVRKAIAFETDPARALEAAQELNDYLRVVDLDPKEMSPKQLRAAARGIYHLQKRELDFLEIADAQGIDAAREKYPDLGLRKVMDLDSGLGTVLSQKYGPGVSGYVGNRDNTEDLSSHEAIAALGLGYWWIEKGEFKHSPFYSAPEGPFTPFKPADRVGVLDMDATVETIQNAKVAAHPRIIAEIEKASRRPEGQWARDLLDRVHANAEPDLYGKGQRDLANPHTGTGAARAGETDLTWSDGDDPSTLNVEQKIARGAVKSVPEGATVSVLDEEGERRQVAEFRSGKWGLTDEAEAHLTPDERARFRGWMEDQNDHIAHRQTREAVEDLPASSPEGKLARAILGQAGELGGNGSSERLHARTRREILDEVVDLNPALRLKALELCRDGGRGDQEELLEVIRQGGSPRSLSKRLDGLRDAQAPLHAQQKTARNRARAHPGYAKVEPFLGLQVVGGRLPAELADLYILDRNGVLRRRHSKKSPSDDKVRLQVIDGRIQVYEGSGRGHDRRAGYVTTGLDEDEQRELDRLLERPPRDLKKPERERLGFLLDKGTPTELYTGTEDTPLRPATPQDRKEFPKAMRRLLAHASQPIPDDPVERRRFLDRRRELLTEVKLLEGRVLIQRRLDERRRATGSDKSPLSEEIGEHGARAFVAQQYPSHREVHSMDGHGSGVFDQVYVNRGGNPEFIIVEAKGGAARNTSGRMVDGERRQQGRRDYGEAVARRMEEALLDSLPTGYARDEFGYPDPAEYPEHYQRYMEIERLKEALDGGDVAYLEVSQTLTKDGQLGKLHARQYAHGYDEGNDIADEINALEEQEGEDAPGVEKLLEEGETL